MRDTPLIGAWATMVRTEDDLRRFLSPWKDSEGDCRLGVVLGGRQLGWKAGQAYTVANYPEPTLALGRNLKAVLCRDEPNVKGLSGERIPAEDYAKLMCNLKKLLPDQRVANGGLAFVTDGWLQEVFQQAHFDDTYFKTLMDPKIGCPTEFHTMNTSSGPYREVDRVLRKYMGKWIIAAISMRPAWGPTRKYINIPAWLVWQVLSFFRINISIRRWVEIAKRDEVACVNFWCLVQTTFKDEETQETLDQLGFGLYKPTDEPGTFVLTSVGRALWRILMRNRLYPIVRLSKRVSTAS